MLPDGRPEPKELQNLHERSPLRAIVKFLIMESLDKIDFPTALKCLECLSKKYSRPIPPMNWFFLIEYVNEGPKFEGFRDEESINLKKFALTIAANQIAHSGSAKALIENYLQSFDVNTKQSDEIQMILEIVANISDGVSPQILASFIQRTIKSSINFENDFHFEMTLKSIAKAFDKKCLIAENINILTDELCRFNDTLQCDSMVAWNSQFREKGFNLN